MVDGVIIIMGFFIEADGFIDATADTITTDGGFTDFFRDDDGEALKMASVFHVDKSNLFPAERFSVAIDIVYTTARMETITATEHRHSPRGFALIRVECRG